MHRPSVHWQLQFMHQNHNRHCCNSSWSLQLLSEQKGTWSDTHTWPIALLGPLKCSVKIRGVEARTKTVHNLGQYCEKVAGFDLHYTGGIGNRFRAWATLTSNEEIMGRLAENARVCAAYLACIIPAVHRSDIWRTQTQQTASIATRRHSSERIPPPVSRAEPSNCFFPDYFHFSHQSTGIYRYAKIQNNLELSPSSFPNVRLPSFFPP